METTTDAIQQAIQVNITLKPKCSCKNIPIKPLFPNNINSIYPVTDGGSTIGNIKIASNTSLRGNLYLTTTYDNATPNMSVIMVEIVATFKDNNMGDIIPSII